MKNLIEAMRAYDAFRITKRAEVQEKKNELAEKYGNGTYYQEESARLDAEAEEDYAQAKKDLKEKIGAKFDNLKQTISDYIATPAPDAFLTLMGVYVNGIKLSPAEAKLLSDKYGKNYLARRAMLPYMGENAVDPETVLSRLLEELDARKKDCETWIDNYNANSYLHGLLITDTEPQPLLMLERDVADFMGQ